ncbi:MAG: ribonuclease HI family protein [Patescibacteria group bacterium]
MLINCDGGSRGNPGPAAFGFVVKSNGKLVKEGFGYIGIATNNTAEYTAVIEALSWLKENTKDEELTFNLDSLLVVSQLNGLYKVKNATIRELIVKIRQLETSFSKIVYKHVPREQNKEADRLVNLALDTTLAKWYGN